MLRTRLLVAFVALPLALVTWRGADAQERADSNGSTSEEGSATRGEVPSPESGGERLPDEVVRDVDWSAADDYRRIDGSGLPDSVRDPLSRSPVPVLVPSRLDALREAEPTVGDHWYAVMLEVDGREVTVEGDRVARVDEDLLRSTEGEETVEEGFVVSQTHGVMTVAFTAFGVAYSVDVECEHLDDSGACTRPDFAVELVDDFARLGGLE